MAEPARSSSVLTLRKLQEYSKALNASYDEVTAVAKGLFRDDILPLLRQEYSKLLDQNLATQSGDSVLIASVQEQLQLFYQRDEDQNKDIDQLLSEAKENTKLPLAIAYLIYNGASNGIFDAQKRAKDVLNLVTEISETESFKHTDWNTTNFTRLLESLKNNGSNSGNNALWVAYPLFVAKLYALLEQAHEFVEAESRHISNEEADRIQKERKDKRDSARQALLVSKVVAGVAASQTPSSSDSTDGSKTTTVSDAVERAARRQKELRRDASAIIYTNRKYISDDEMMRQFLAFGLDRNKDSAFLEELMGKFEKYKEEMKWEVPTDGQSPANSSQSNTVSLSFSQILSNNPTLAESIRNYALGVSLVRVNGMGEQTELARFVANQLANSRGGVYDINRALQNNPAFLRQFQVYFFGEVARVRSQQASQGTIALLEGINNPSNPAHAELDKLSKEELIELVASLANSTLGVEGALKALSLKPSQAKAEIESAVTPEDRQHAQLVADVQTKTLVVLNRAQTAAEKDELARGEATNIADMSIEERLNLVQYYLNAEEKERIAAKMGELQEQAAAITNASADAPMVLPLGDDQTFDSGYEDTASGGGGSEGMIQPAGGKRKQNALQRARNLKRKMNEARQTLQVAKFFASPAGMAAGAAAGGAAVFLAGLAAQAPGIMGIGGAIAGGGFGALGGLIGSFILPGVGTLAGMAVGTGIGSLVGGVGGYTYGQSLFSGQAAETARAFANAGQTGLSAVPKVATEMGSKAAISSKGILPSGQAIGKLASSGVNGLSAGIKAVSSTSMNVPIVPIMGSTLGGTALLAFVINTSFMSAFLVPGSISSCSQTDDGVKICKSASVMNAPDPEDVTYTIDITAPKTGAMTIVEISDAATVHASKEGQTPPTVTLPQEATDQFNAKKNSVINPGSSIQISYMIPYSQDKNFDDTQILNTVSVKYTLAGKNATGQATAQVIFGEVKYGGCWPTTGTITQGAFTKNPSQTTHSLVDAIDIFANEEGGPNAPIFSPFAGSIQFFCTAADPSCGHVFSPPIYGNVAKLSTEGKIILFGHMSSFANNPQTGTPFLAGNTYTLTDKGTQIGFMGKSGSGLKGSSRAVTFSEHLHYELMSNYNAPSEIQSILPEPLQTDSSLRGVPGTQRVRYDTCGSASTEPPTTGEEVAVVKCFHFINGSKTWSPSELASYTKEITALTTPSGASQALCGDNVAFNIVRQDLDPTSETEGCNYDGLGQAGAEWTDPFVLNVCDKLFDPSQAATFGVFTMWHEAGHAYQHKHSNWTSFPDFGSSGYLPTYPLGKTRNEDFAESFGFCQYNKNYRPNFMTAASASFRGISVPQSVFKPHCEEMNKLVDPAAGLPIL